MIGIESGKHFACAAFVRTTVVTIIPSPLQRLHGFGYNGIVRIHLSTWLVLQLEGSVHSVPRDVTLPSLDSCIAQHADVMDQDMMEQNVQTLITWTHGAHPAWLQYHGPARDAREYPRRGGTQLHILPPPPPPPLTDPLLPPPPPPPPPELLHPQLCPHYDTRPPARLGRPDSEFDWESGTWVRIQQ